MYSREGLLKMIEDNPTSYIKCTFRVDTSGKQSRYCGQVPAPDSPDIQIPGRVEGVYEDDIVLLELQPSFVVPGKQGEEEVIRFGCIKGKYNFISCHWFTIKTYYAYIQALLQF